MLPRIEDAISRTDPPDIAFRKELRDTIRLLASKYPDEGKLYLALIADWKQKHEQVKQITRQERTVQP